MVVPKYYAKEVEPKPIIVHVEQPPKKLGERSVHAGSGFHPGGTLYSSYCVSVSKILCLNPCHSGSSIPFLALRIVYQTVNQTRPLSILLETEL